MRSRRLLEACRAAGARAARHAGDLALAAVVAGLAFGLKAFHSRAGFEELRWVLDPTVRLVEWFGAGPFELEPHRAWLSRADRFEVVAACAGVNFMVVAFVSLCVALLPGRAGFGGRLGGLAAGALAAYAVTLLANATRIALAIRLHDPGFSAGPLAPGRLHTVEGIVVYFVFLAVAYAAAVRLAGAPRLPPLEPLGASRAGAARR
jgi:exosortase K